MDDCPSQSISAAKSALRTEIRSRITRADHAQRVAADDSIQRQLAESGLLAVGGVICGFLALRDEPNLKGLLTDLLREGRRVALPEAMRQSADGVPLMRMIEVEAPEGLSETRRGLHGTSVPSAGSEVAPEAISVVLTPGVAFDAAGTRLGRGGGFYDAFLAALPPTTLLIGVAYEVQVVDRVPRAEHDRSVDWLCTERRLLRTG
ncbi:MAG: 5-formyltetrahydrofolate cyclo-ligase [Phycisphaeraceae bacterium]|nr:5-formyltetrahydrofolate cyclo-ligase [Phycisphaeraceae bacterium]